MWKVIKKLNDDKYFGALYDANVIQKKLENSARYGDEEGRDNRSKEIVLSMLQDDIDIETIMKYTELNNEELVKLKEEVGRI